MEFKVVIGTKEGKSYQKEFKGAEAEALQGKSIGETISGDRLGFLGYEFIITGGSDKCGFPLRKGIRAVRKKILIGKSVGFSGKDRNDKKRKGLLVRRVVCGERITDSTHQVNLKVVKVGSSPLAPPAEEKKEAPKEE